MCTCAFVCACLCVYVPVCVRAYALCMCTLVCVYIIVCVCVCVWWILTSTKKAAATSVSDEALRIACSAHWGCWLGNAAEAFLISHCYARG